MDLTIHLELPWLMVQLTAFLLTLKSSVSAIDCFVCQSHNGSDHRCHDPFDADYNIFSKKCQNGIRGRRGLFPGRFCVKMNGKSLSSGREMYVRTCALQSLENQCGIFDFENEKYEGCVMTCDKDACNSAGRLSYFSAAFYSFVIIGGLLASACDTNSCLSLVTKR